MPTYELSIIYKAIAKPELKTVIKRTAQAIFAEDGIIRKIENLGTRNLPYRMMNSAGTHKVGSYMLFHFDCRPESIAKLIDLFKRDYDVVNKNVSRVEEKEKRVQCTLGEEMLPPSYRPDVQKLIAISNSRRKKKMSKLNYDEYTF